MQMSSAGHIVSSADGASAFSLACAVCGAPIEAEEVRRRFGYGAGFGVSSMLRAAQALGLKARAVRPSAARLGRTVLPAVAQDQDGGFFVLARLSFNADGGIDKFRIQAPGGRPEQLELETFLARWSGALVLLSRRHSIGDMDRPFGLSWFFSAVTRYQRILGEVFLVSFALELPGLATPLFFQVVVDKVLVHKGASTLDVIVVGLGLAMTFEVLMGGLRSYVFSHCRTRCTDRSSI